MPSCIYHFAGRSRCLTFHISRPSSCPQTPRTDCSCQQPAVAVHHNTTHSHSSRHETKRHTHPFNGPFSRTTWVSQYQKGKTNLDFTDATDSEWQWHQLGHMQACTSLQTDNHTSTPLLSFLQAGCPCCHPTNSVKSLKTKK